MILDRQNLVSQAQAVTTTAVSTDTIDLSQARDVGPGEEVKFSITIDQSFATATSVEFQVISSAAANLGSPTVLVTTGAIAIAQLVAGRRPIELSVPRSVLAAQPIGQRFLGMNYVVAGSAATAGQITAGVVHTVQDIGKNYASGFAVV
jgi:hypothetical protein